MLRANLSAWQRSVRETDSHHHQYCNVHQPFGEDADLLRGAMNSMASAELVPL